jgi:hypothetical protein
MHTDPPGHSESSVQKAAFGPHPANPKSSTSGMKIAGTPRTRMSQSMGSGCRLLRAGVAFAGMRMGRATDKGDEFPPPHAAPKAKDHDLIITPRIAAREADYPIFAPEKSD